MASWKWNEKLQRYQSSTGKIISFADAALLIDDAIDATGIITDQLAQMLANHELSLADWFTRMKATIKESYIQQAILAAGGRDQMTAGDWGVVGGTVKEQYQYLIGFANQIGEGQLTQGQIASRSRMYTNSAREAYWRIKDRQALERGDTEERWVTAGDGKECNACFDAGKQGWVGLGTFAQPGSGVVQVDPEITHCSGLTNCRCQKIYR